MAFSEAQTPDSIFLESVGQRYIFEEGEKRKMVTKKEEENSQDKVLIFHKSSFLFSLFFSFLDKFSSLEKSQEEFKRPRFRKPHGTLIPAISGSGRLDIVCLEKSSLAGKRVSLSHEKLHSSSLMSNLCEIYAGDSRSEHGVGRASSGLVKTGVCVDFGGIFEKKRGPPKGKLQTASFSKGKNRVYPWCLLLLGKRWRDHKENF